MSPALQADSLPAESQLEWVVYPFSSGSSQPKNLPGFPALQADSLPTELWGKPITAESEELKSLSMKVKEETGKVGLKFNIQKMEIMASGPITSCK